MTKFEENKRKLQVMLETHPFMADIPDHLVRLASVEGDHLSIVLYNKTRTFCWRTVEECEAFIKEYGAVQRRIV